MTRQEQIKQFSMEEIIMRIRRGGNFSMEEQEEGNQDTYLVRVAGSSYVSGVIKRPFLNAPASPTIDYRDDFNKNGLAGGIRAILEGEWLRSHAFENGIIPKEVYPTGNRSRYIALLRSGAEKLTELAGGMR